MLNEYPPLATVQAEPDEVIRFIEDRFVCAQACVECARACTATVPVPELGESRRPDLKCAQVCETTRQFLSREDATDPEVHRGQVEYCADVCALCAAACERLAPVRDECARCAEACRRCERACREFLECLA
ncbi:hypothetical protein ACFQVC_35865 [Streptomyces monticola]|uniref:Four-helix bundle copper-binding protein n=1 Tax=Streptomyces monticola TaxID=2666263 RepID=A0ABW2JV85_9ACTN